MPPGSKPEELRRLFEKYGVVTECDIMSRCGFVHMQTEEMAASAIKALDKVMFNGNSLSVEQGRLKDRNAGKGANGGGRKFGGGNQGNRQGGGGGNRRDNRGGSGSSGPLRRDRGNNNRGGPYNRGGGGGGGYDRMDGGMNMNRGGPMGMLKSNYTYIILYNKFQYYL